MAHYALIDTNGQVVEIITGRDEGDLAPGVDDWETYYASKRDGLTCKRTSFNTVGGEHKEGGQPFRMNYAGIGYTYDEARDAFIPPTPEDDGPWVLNDETCLWIFSVPMPDDGQDYVWDESAGEWVAVPEPTE